MKIKVVTGYEGNCIYSDLVLSNMREYCDKWGYELIASFGEFEPFDRHPYWRKQQLIIKDMADCDYLLWIDADCLFMDMTRPLAYYAAWSDIIMTHDETLQAGCMMFSVNQWTKSFLNTWWRCGSPDYTPAFAHPKNDNEVLTEMVQRNPRLLEHFHLHDKHNFVVKNVHYHSDTFILHVPGATEEDKLSELSLYFDKVKR